MAFKPNAKARRMLAQGSSAAWIYRDGVAIQEKRRAKVGKHRIQQAITHVFPCEVDIISNSKDMRVQRIVVHNPTLLLSGVQLVRVHYGTQTRNMADMGITATCVEIVTPIGTEIPVYRFRFLSAGVTVQPDLPEVDPFATMEGTPDSIQTYHEPDPDTLVEWHKEGTGRPHPTMPTSC
jgi:hypothetical protein